MWSCFRRNRENSIMLLGTCTAKYVLNSAPLLVLAKRADMLCCLLCFFFFNSRALWNPFLECRRLWQVPDLVSQPKPGWAQRWMICYPGAGPCSCLNGFRKCRCTIDEVPAQGYEAVMRTHPNPPQERLPRSWRRGKECLEKEVAVTEISSSLPQLSIRDLEGLRVSESSWRK